MLAVISVTAISFLILALGYNAVVGLATEDWTGYVTYPRLRAVLYMLTPIFPVGVVVGVAFAAWKGLLTPLGQLYRRLWGEAFPRG